jgi:hypothetical protein
MTKKETLNVALKAMIGRDDLVEAWWTSENRYFSSQTPNDVWITGLDGEKKVINYVLSFLQK